MFNFKLPSRERVIRFFTLPQRVSKALFHTFWHLLGTLLPLLIAFLLSVLFYKQSNFENFITHGEFCILSAAILTPASYLLSQFGRDKEQKLRTIPSFFYLISVAIILITSVLFASVYMKELFGDLKINTGLVKILSIFFLCISAFIFFIAQYFNIEKAVPNMKAQEVKNINDIDAGFDDLP